MKYAPVSILEYPVHTGQKSQLTDVAIEVELDFFKKAGQRAQYDENIRVIHLNEVVVTAQRRANPRDEARLSYIFNKNSDYTIYWETIEKRPTTYVTEQLSRIAGIRVSANGEISIRGGGPPIVLIDGMQMDWPDGPLNSIYDSPLETVNIAEVESVDVFRGGASTVLFGGRGANGVISITTRRWTPSSDRPDFNTNYASFAPLGYQTPVEFYAPKYDTPQSKNLNTPDYRTTIYWKPDLVVSDDGKASFDFYTSDFSTTYSVVIEGISDDGRIIRQVETIVVR